MRNNFAEVDFTGWAVTKEEEQSAMFKLRDWCTRHGENAGSYRVCVLVNHGRGKPTVRVTKKTRNGVFTDSGKTKNILTNLDDALKQMAKFMRLNPVKDDKRVVSESLIVSQALNGYKEQAIDYHLLAMKLLEERDTIIFSLRLLHSQFINQYADGNFEGQLWDLWRYCGIADGPLHTEKGDTPK